MKVERKKEQGMTLVETVIAMMVFSIVALGITAMVTQHQKLSEGNLIRNKVHAVIQGYLEQLKSIGNNEIHNAIADPANVPLPTEAINPLAANNVTVADVLYIGQENVKNMVMDIDDENSQTMNLTIKITPTVNNLNDGSYGADAIPAFEFILDFTYEARHLRGVESSSGSMRIIKAVI